MIGVSVNNGSTVRQRFCKLHNRLLKGKPCKQTWKKVDAALKDGNTDFGAPLKMYKLF
jgi:hypothetical protein